MMKKILTESTSVVHAQWRSISGNAGLDGRDAAGRGGHLRGASHPGRHEQDRDDGGHEADQRGLQGVDAGLFPG